MTYRLIQLAPGAYDLILHDNVVASGIVNLTSFARYLRIFGPGR
ncbi:hypothetical protein [Microvirga arvi]|nr:hypothetical protein [Microvirga arvi]